jgi:hypothetical protein
MLIAPLTDYVSSRRAVLDAAAAHGATFSRHVHPLAGPSGEELSTDVARIGPPPGEARAVVLASSGTHGVEGHAGTGLQLLMLADPRLASLPADVALVFVHALNPYGMAWSRRVDHENIDVNRNFVDFAGALPTNDLYWDIDPVMNPSDPTFDPEDDAWQQEVWDFIGRVGMMEGFVALSGGQYAKPTGMQYGGAGPSWSRRTIEAIWRTHVAGAELALDLDIHTGLGPPNVLTLFQTADAEEPAGLLGAEWFPSVARYDRTTTDKPQSGLLGPGLHTITPDGTLGTTLTVEFGTCPEAVVLGAMRADNWLHQHGDPTSPLGETIRARCRDAFFVGDDVWRTAVADDGMAVFHQALDCASARGAAATAREAAADRAAPSVTT